MRPRIYSPALLSLLLSLVVAVFPWLGFPSNVRLVVVSIAGCGLILLSLANLGRGKNSDDAPSLTV